jgi:hypothetical protein
LQSRLSASDDENFGNFISTVFFDAVGNVVVSVQARPAGSIGYEAMSVARKDADNVF